jgi:predicted GNAT superfamily acetyltransferase
VIQVRALHETSEFEEAVQLQQQIWGFDEIELLPVRLFVVASKIGGQAMGAYDSGRMIAFLLAIPGIRGEQPYLHSHMLGVLPEYRDRGVGRLMKLEQRRNALARGIRVVEWTFDPLELKNAFFNIERLGVIVRRFNPNQYGTTSSHLHGGLPTDRLVAEWLLDSARVEAVVGGQPSAGPCVEARVSVPSEIAQIRATEPARAREVQRAIGEQFQSNFACGLAVIGFERSPEAGTYLIGPWQSE